MKGLINWASGERTEKAEDTGKVLLYYLQSLYYQSVSDQRAQFNEAVFLVLSPSVPISPNASPHFFLASPLSLSSFLFSPFVFICPIHICSLRFHL